MKLSSTLLMLSSSLVLAESFHESVIDGGAMVVGEFNDKRVLYVNSNESALNALRGSCEKERGIFSDGGFFKIGKKGAEIAKRENLSYYIELDQNQTNQSLTTPNGYAECRYDDEVIEFDSSVIPGNNLVVFSYSKDEDSVIFKDNNVNDTHTSKFFKEAKECHNRRGRVVVGFGESKVEYDQFVQELVYGPRGVDDYKDLYLACADTKNGRDAYVAYFNGDFITYSAFDASKASIERTPLVFNTTEKSREEMERESTYYHTNTRYSGELAVIEPVFNTKVTQISNDGSRSYLGIYMGYSGNCELGAVQSGYTTPSNLEDLYRGKKQVINTENFKKCGGEITYNGESVSMSIPKQLYTPIEGARQLCELNGQSTTTYQGYTIMCQSKGNDAYRGSRHQEFVIHSDEKLVAYFFAGND